MLIGENYQQSCSDFQIHNFHLGNGDKHCRLAKINSVKPTVAQITPARPHQPLVDCPLVLRARRRADRLEIRVAQTEESPSRQ